MIRRIIYAAVLALLVSTASRAQVRAAGSAGADEILRIAKHHLQRGEACLLRNDTDCARREFDSAVDEVLGSAIDLRSDERLLASWREMLVKINGYETAPLALDGKPFWKVQEFEGRPAEDVVVAKQTDRSTSLDPGTFQGKFAELQKRFREKYGRDITLTGADHAEHRRLYGSGSAYDIRVRDLNREQVKFIISTGNGLGLRIKDFSTWESVAAHNARSIMLGRPWDTLATGIHLHIDRMAVHAKKMIAVPSVSTKPRRETKP